MQVRRPQDRDLLIRISRGLVYVGMFFLPLWKFYVTSTLSVSDAIFAVSAVVLVLSIGSVRAPKVPGGSWGAS